MRNLDELRDALDKLDSEIIRLLDERCKITDQVDIYKNAHGLPIYDKKREDLIKARLKTKANHPAVREHLNMIYDTIFVANRKYRQLNQQKIMPYKSVGIIGLGLIGGSIAKALKSKNNKIKIYTVKRENSLHESALATGYVDKECQTIEELISQVELVVLCSPIESIIPYAQALHSYRSHPQKKLIVIDAGSVKTEITSAFENFTSDSIEFLATHPMSGSEQTGFEAGNATLFVNRPWVITAHSKNTEETIESIKKFITYVGSKPVQIDASTHDKWVSVVSHLVFILSVYLFNYSSTIIPDALAVAGTGFESMTRLASGNVKMHEQITKTNYVYIVQALNSFVEYMQHHHISKENAHNVYDSAKKKRDIFIGGKT